MNENFVIILFFIILICGYFLKFDISNNTKKMIDNKIFRIGIILFITYYSNINIEVSLYLSIIYLVLLNSLNDKKIKEDFENLNIILF
tara:strand:- start:1437 stop:1700 length:264 start_codon:yes stop_codon:yes gene_type:complete